MKNKSLRPLLSHKPVIPAQAGIHIFLILLKRIFWTPAFAGVTMTFHTASQAGIQ